MGLGVAGLAVLVLGAFLTTVYVLPRPTDIIYSRNAIDRFFKMRTDWYIAWAVLFGGSFSSVSIFLIVEAFVKKNE